MLKYTKNYMIGLFCLIPFLSVGAQQDSTGVKDRGFNALQYSLQKRYRPKGYEFSNKDWSDHLYLSGQLGFEGIAPRQGADIRGGSRFSIAAGKLFTPAHSARVSLNGGWFGRETSNEKLSHFGIGASYLFNITAHLKGYDPSRLFEVSTVSGIGYQLSTGAGETFHIGELHLGAQFKLNIHRQLDFFVEPQFTFYSDGIDHYSQKNWHKYDMGYSASIGVIYRLKDPLKSQKQLGSRDRHSLLENTFISVAGGVQFQNSDFVKEMGILNSIGPHINVSVGKWYTPYLGIRFSGFYSTDKWHEFSPQQFETTTYGGLRVEGMFNVLGLRDTDSKRRFSLSGLLGAEAGYMNKTDEKSPLKSTYLGLTGGVQLAYRFTRNLSVFIEPRGSLVPYSNIEKAPENWRTDIRKKYSDNLFNLNLGITWAN